MQLCSAVLAGWVQPADIFVQFFNNEPHSFWLDREFHSNQRFSILGAGFPDIKNEFDYTRSDLADAPISTELPFTWRPGLIGWISYEGEQRFMRVDRAIVFDNDAQRLFFVGLFNTQAQFDDWHHAALLRLGLSGGQVAQYLHGENPDLAPTSVRLRQSPAEYLNLILKAQKHIVAGDVYQVCLTNQIEVQTLADPLAVFLKLRLANPAPYACFIKMNETVLAGTSPEQFISVSAEGQISSKPIKGTRPRSDNFDEDQASAEELRTDAKERAENLMIVDLMRNDLGKVAEVGSVSVPLLFQIEKYATVHQLVSTVNAQKVEEISALDVVLAAFPGGSMTGAPKIRAMEIISELEREHRGVYSGCAGYLGFDGSAEFSMTIRSIVFDAGIATIGIGGGITIDSNPEAELAETRLKAKALLEALNAPDPWVS